MVKVNFSAYANYVTDTLYQWDIGRVLNISGIDSSVAPEVHFSNANMERAIVRQATVTDNVISVSIPNSILQMPLTIHAHVGIYEADAFKVIEKIEIPVIARTRPADYQLEDSNEEIYSFNKLENEIANAKKDIKNLNDAYLDELRFFVSQNTESLNTRIDNIIAHNDDTESNTELIDIRTGVDGTVYGSAGEAVRQQVSKVNNDVTSVKSDLSQLSSEINEVKETLVESELTKIIDLQAIKNTGKFITDNGTLEANESFSYSNPIFIPKGKLISFFARGYYNSVSMIAEYHNIDTQYEYTPLVKCGNDNEDKLYHYITTKDMMIAFCWETATEPTLSITDILTNNYERYVTSDYISMFHKIAGIGDSLMSGCLCSDDETRVEDCYEYSWLSSIARNHGLEKVHYSHGGYTAKDWSEGGYVSQMQEDSFDAIFIGLGTNDKNQSYPLGTLTDTSDTNSFVGYYTKILEQIRAYHLNTPIFCLSLYDKSTQTAIEYSDMIRRIACIHDNCYFVDVANLSDVLVYDTTYTSGYHFTTVGYIRLAKNIERIVNQIVDEHRNDFKLFGLPTN